MVWNEKFAFADKHLEVVIIGEVVVDTIIHNDLNLVSNIIGGSPFNICKNLTNLSIINRFYGAIGNDKNGQNVLQQIQSRGINAEINITDFETSTVTMDQTISSPLPIFHRSADSEIHLSNCLINDIAKTKLLHFSYWPLSEEPSRSTILSLLDKARENKTLIGFDPNYHPLLDDDMKTGLKTLKEVINRIDIIKPSLDDSLRIFGEHTVDEYLDIYEKLGAKLIIMTLGKNGLIARYKKQTIKMPSLATKVIDATGAGDAFWSGLYTGLLKGKSIYNSFEMGLLASSLKMRTIGPDFDVDEFQRLLNIGVI
ncbi:MAG: PfkB family carbohydrate kinase [Candidatus Izemoplasmatales bacterium]|nr:PfkB family carbohydrate kinase [Candidatus Izemoplasmatales bacterium]